MPTARSFKVSSSPFSLINKGSPPRVKKEPSLSATAEEFSPSPPSSPSTTGSGYLAATVSSKAKTEVPPGTKKHPGGAAASNFTFPESPSATRQRNQSAASAYRAKVKSGTLGIDESERACAKAASYDNWSPSAPTPKVKTVDSVPVKPTSLAVAAAKIKAANMAPGVGHDDDVLTIGSSSSSSGSSLLKPNPTIDISTVKVFRSNDSVSTSDESASVHKMYKKKNDSYDSLFSEGSAERALLLAQVNREKAAAKENTQASVEVLSIDDDSVEVFSSVAGSVNPNDLTAGRDKSPPPKVSGGGFFKQDTVFGAFSPSKGEDLVVYNPRCGQYSRKLTRETTHYFSGLQLELALKKEVNKSTDRSPMHPAHHANGPFTIFCDKVDGIFKAKNGKGVVVCVMGSKPQSYFNDPQVYLGIDRFKFKRDKITSFDYPTRVLAQMLQETLARVWLNDSGSPCYPTFGPFRVVRRNGASWIVNRDNVECCELPCLSVVADQSRPWLGEISSSLKKSPEVLPVSSQSAAATSNGHDFSGSDKACPSASSATKTDFVSSKRQKNHNAKEMEVDTADDDSPTVSPSTASTSTASTPESNSDMPMENVETPPPIKNSVSTATPAKSDNDGDVAMKSADDHSSSMTLSAKAHASSGVQVPKSKVASDSPKTAPKKKRGLVSKCTKKQTHLSFSQSPMKSSEVTKETLAEYSLPSSLESSPPTQQVPANATSPASVPTQTKGTSNSSSPASQLSSTPSENNAQSSNQPSITGTINGSTEVSEASSAPSSTPAPATAPALRQSSFPAPPQNEVPPILPTQELSQISLGDVPRNSSDTPLIIQISAPPVEGQHPMTTLYAAIRMFATAGSRYDPSLVFCPLHATSSLPNIKASDQQNFPDSLQHMPAYYEATENQLKRVTGTYQNGKKKKQGRTYAVIMINSDIDPRFLISKLAPIMDVDDIGLSVKQLQRINTVSHWCLGGLFSQVDMQGVQEMIQKALEEEWSQAKATSKLGMMSEVPSFTLSVKAIQLGWTPPGRQGQDHTNLEYYSAQLRRAFHIECAVQDVDDMDTVLAAVEATSLLRKRVSSRCTVIFIPRRGDNADNRLSFREKVEAHMAYQAGTGTMEVSDLEDLDRKVQVVMAPDGNGQKVPPDYKYTSIRRELTSLMSQDDKQLIDGLVPVTSGPRQGMTTVIFKQVEEAEALVCSLARDPCPFIYHLLTEVKKFRPDMVITLCRSCSVVSRGRIPLTTWNSEYWTVESPRTVAADNFAADMLADGYRLSDSDRAQKVMDISTVIASQDMQQVVQDLGLRGDATFASRNGAASIVSGGSGATLGNSSVRTADTQQAQRNLAEECIARAQAFEKAAQEKWGGPPPVDPSQDQRNVYDAVAQPPITPRNLLTTIASLANSSSISVAPSGSPVAAPIPAPSQAPFNSSTSTDVSASINHNAVVSSSSGSSTPAPTPAPLQSPSTSNTSKGTSLSTSQGTPAPTSAPSQAPSASQVTTSDVPITNSSTMTVSVSQSASTSSTPDASASAASDLPANLHQGSGASPLEASSSQVRYADDTIVYSAQASSEDAMSSGEPASDKLRGLGNQPLSPDKAAGEAGGPRGPR